MRSTRTVRRAVGTAAVALTALLTLTGCFLDTPPPKASVASMDELTTGLERLPHVAAVHGELRQVDPKDHPDDWLAEVTVRADSADLAVAAAVRDRARDAVTGARLVLTLEVPRGTGRASVRVDPTDPAVVAAADRLRRVDVVRSVELSTRQDLVRVRDGASWTTAAAAVRPFLGTRDVVLADGHGTVEVDATRPGPALLRVLDSGVVDEPSLSIGPTFAAVAAGPPGWTDRSSLSAEVDDPAALAALLAGTADEAADAHLAPRTRFVLWQRGTGASARGEEDGYLGLPLDAAAPDDLTPPGSAAPHGGADGSDGSGSGGGAGGGGGGGGAGGVPSPAWTAAPVPAQTAAVRAFLEAAARTTGVATEVSTTVEPCAPTGTDDQTGTRAVASAVVPVFTRYDDAQEPFDAVVGQWRAEGFRAGGSAMGRDSWTAPPPGPEGVASASIRGTAEGLSLDARSACVG